MIVILQLTSQYFLEFFHCSPGLDAKNTTDINIEMSAVVLQNCSTKYGIYKKKQK